VHRQRWFWSIWWLLWAAIAFPWGTLDGIPRWQRVQWIPFDSVRPRDIALNLVFFTPFGWLGERAGWRATRVLIAAFALSLVTEVVQVYSSGRWPSTTDILVNVSGAILGLLAARL
jgi:glycopeptide antibiotics resistance protein